ncbi:hypothetical protein [Caulobacter hibisci]|uniref:Lipoprotein n=1 Tax=Caulobacter hibisci TaxID=2035993 RepID=A0ABS0SYY3_9CAUL|nr:hypothetical protein [Caulobacter hibisci]MBI1684759.1 hypothetical protein [Caulobacter hibisci]
MRRLFATLVLSGLAACGPAALGPPKQPPPPPAGFVETRSLSLDQADDPYQRVVETGLAETAAASGEAQGDTVTYRSPPGETRAAIEAHYRQAADQDGWTPDRTLAPPAGSRVEGYWSFGYRAGKRWFQVAGVTPGPALPVPEAGLPVVVRSNAD